MSATPRAPPPPPPPPRYPQPQAEQQQQRGEAELSAHVNDPSAAAAAPAGTSRQDAPGRDAPAGQIPAAGASLTNRHSFQHNSAAVLPPLDTASAATLTHRSTHHASPASAGLSLRTNLREATIPAVTRPTDTPTIMYESSANEPTINHNLTSPTTLPTMGSSLRSNMSTSSLTSSLSPGSASALPSPYLAAMTDLTPLPSPLLGSDAPPVWRKRSVKTPNRSRDNSLNDPSLTSNPGQPVSPDSPSRRRKTYNSLMQEATIANASREAGGQEGAKASAHTRNRSVSDFKPETLHNVRQRHVTFGSGDAPNIESTEYHMQREAYLAAQRGIAGSHLGGTKQLPTPPPSNSSMQESEDVEEEQPYLEDGTASEFLEIHCGIHNKQRKFRQLRQLGQGTFSTVMLATREKIPAHPTPEIEDHLDPHKLVAIKIIEHGPAGGADEERIETGLKREVEILKSISHPSLIHLKACEYQDTRALLVVTYCPGGDLFEFASNKRELLTPKLVQRMFAELVSATRYLHAHWIVHRDIKLENVLVNLSDQALRSLDDPLSHPTPLVTLTDLGLSRKIPPPPESPLLTTRCGSEDYAAPEILLGQPYDGRLTDGWALGVLLYALMEGRLPFDAPPGKPDRSRNTHRIARCDWIWCRFGDEDGEWDEARPGSQEFAGAQLAVEGLLKKVRMGRQSLDDIEKLPWVQGGIQVPGGLRMRDEDDDSDLL